VDISVAVDRSNILMDDDNHVVNIQNKSDIDLSKILVSTLNQTLSRTVSY
jgi:hypothetical protein